MDMREMVDKVKRKEPLYGSSSLSPYMQGVASRNSRYTGVWLHVIPWFNFVNHEQVCYSFLIKWYIGKLMVSSTAWTLRSTINKLKESLLLSELKTHKGMARFITRRRSLAYY